MYEENNARFSIKDAILQIILVVLFVFLLLWLFPTKSYVDKKLKAVDDSLQPLYSQIFNQNITTMKEAAVSYFTTSRLPKNIGDKATLTLSEMLDKKLLTSFVDSNNKQCDLTSSYVELTKMDDEYIMKVNLSCSDKSDYILVHLGCYSYCPTGICENKATVTATAATTKPTVLQMVNKNYEYEYELVINGKWGDWSNWSEWSINRATATDYRQVKTKQEQVVSGTETIKVGTNVNVTDATATTNYTCPSGYTKNGTKCNKVVSGTSSINATATTSYSCASGYTLSGTKCYKNTNSSINATAKTTYSCPSGYTLSGTKCNKSTTTSINATKGGYYTSWEYSYRDEFTSKKVSSSTVDYRFISSRTAISCNDACKTVTYYTYNVYKRSWVTIYSCPSGYTKSGTKCNKTTSSSINATAKTNYSCSSGYTLSGTKCNKTTSSSINATAKANYSCPSGYTLSGTKCNKTTSSTETINASTSTSYSCKTGDLVGRSCITYIDKYQTYNTYTTVTYYSYRERTYISGDRKIVWSRSQNDTSLLNQGYSLTGKSREI